MTEQWQELKKTIIEMRDNDNTSTQQEACKFLANLMDIFEKQMSSSDFPNRWISVSEKLPEPYVDVIVTNGIEMYMGWIDPMDKGWRVDSESEYFMKDIVAWMPLPKEYRGEQA